MSDDEKIFEGRTVWEGAKGGRSMHDLAVAYSGRGVVWLDKTETELVDVHISRHEAEVLSRYWLELQPARIRSKEIKAGSNHMKDYAQTIDRDTRKAWGIYLAKGNITEYTIKFMGLYGIDFSQYTVLEPCSWTGRVNRSPPAAKSHDRSADRTGRS